MNAKSFVFAVCLLMTTIGRSYGSSTRVSSEQAKSLWEHSRPLWSRSKLDRATDITSSEIWEKTRAQVFKSDFVMFAVRDGKVFKLAGSFGGLFDVPVVVDLNSDGKPELLYTYSDGSGVNYSLVGLFDVATGRAQGPLVRGLFHEFRLRRISPQLVALDDGPPGKTVEIGTIAKSKRWGEVGEVRLKTDLAPSALKDVVLRP